jgi:hypothetical protein
VVVSALLAVVAGLLTGQSPVRADVPAPQNGFTTVWSDDFAGSAGSGVDTGSWLYSTGTSYPGGTANWGTGEIETMTASTANVALDGAGHLAITPVRDEAGNWTSGRIETQRTDFTAPAGGVLRVEASLQQPDVTVSNGIGYWPAFWMLGADARPAAATNWPGIGEIDIMEDVNGRSSVWSTMHCGVSPGGPCNERTGLGSDEHACPGCQTDFHTYAMEYDRSVSPEELRWYLDGENTYSLSADAMDATTWTNAVQHGFFIILNVAIGGSFPTAFGGGSPTEATVSGQPMLVDYVSIATKAGFSPNPPTTAPAEDRSAYSTLQAESYDSQSGTSTRATTDTDGGNSVRSSNGDWLAYRGVDFGTAAATQFRARVSSPAGPGVSGLVEVRLDSRSNAPVSRFEVGNTRGWKTVSMNMSAVTGVHDVYLTFTSGQPADFVDVNWFTFAR